MWDAVSPPHPASVGLTRLRDVVPVRRVELVVPGQDFAEEVLVVVLVIILVRLLVERGVPREAGGRGGGLSLAPRPPAPRGRPVPRPALTGCT